MLTADQHGINQQNASEICIVDQPEYGGAAKKDTMLARFWNMLTRKPTSVIEIKDGQGKVIASQFDSSYFARSQETVERETRELFAEAATHSKLLAKTGLPKSSWLD